MDLYDPVHTRFTRFCQARAYTNCEAKDLISETVLRAYEHFDSLRDHKAFLSFLFSTASNILHSKRRRSKFWGIFQVQDTSQKFAGRNDGELSADVILLYEALHKLPSEQSEAIILFEISGFSLKEVQAIQGVSLSAVKSRIVRGKRKLARLLHDKETLSLLEGSQTEEEQFARLSTSATISITF